MSAERDWRYLVAIPTANAIAFGFWMLLDYLIPPTGCSIFDAFVVAFGGDATCPPPYAATLLHAAAAFLTSMLAVYILFKMVRRQLRKNPNTEN